MDTENTENAYHPSASGGSTSGEQSQGGGARDFLSCLPLAPGVCQALRRLRAPALCMTYHMEGHIIPDLDAARQSCPPSDGTNQNTSSGDSSSQSPDNSQEQGQTGGQQTGGQGGSFPNRMHEEKRITIRLFDLSLCAVGMMLATCMVKCCCGCARGMKHMCHKLF